MNRLVSEWMDGRTDGRIGRRAGWNDAYFNLHRFSAFVAELDYCCVNNDSGSRQVSEPRPYLTASTSLFITCFPARPFALAIVKDGIIIRIIGNSGADHARWRKPRYQTNFIQSSQVVMVFFRAFCLCPKISKTGAPRKRAVQNVPLCESKAVSSPTLYNLSYPGPNYYHKQLRELQ